MDTSRTFVKILEEPAPKALRFRYECEGRSAGSLPGAKSTNEKKTFPKIQIVGPTTGRAVVVVSCVTFDPPYRPHPHNLVGKEGCKKGVCTLEIANEDMTCEFSNLGIQCVKKKDIEDSLKIREEIRVDPFRTGFSHKSQPGSIDLNSVRLCFQVFLEGPEHGQFKIPLKAVVSEPIYDKKAINDLTIMKLSECSSPVIGNREIILLCDKVSKDDIEIRLYEEAEDGTLVWESFADFQPSDVHKQYAICFRTPQYKDLEITSPINAFIQLRCPSKDTTSLPRPFQYVPLSSGIRSNKRLWAAAMAASYDSALETSVSQPAEKRQNLEDLLGVEDAYKCLNDFIVSDTNASGEGRHVEYNAEEIEKIKKQLEGLGQEDAMPMDIDGRQSECQISDVKVEQSEGAAGEGHITMETNPVYSSFELAMKNPIEFNEAIDKAFYNQLGPADLVPQPPPRPPKLKYEGEINVPPPALPPRKKKPSGGGGLFRFFTGGKGKPGSSPSKQADPETLKRKRQKLAENHSQRLVQYFNNEPGLIKRQRSSFPPLMSTEIKQEQPDYPMAIGFSGGGLQNYYNPNQEMHGVKQNMQSPVHQHSPMHIPPHLQQHPGSPIMHLQSPMHPGHQSPLHAGAGHQSPNPFQQQMMHQQAMASSSQFQRQPQGGIQTTRQLHNIQSPGDNSQMVGSPQGYQPAHSPLLHTLQPANALTQQMHQQPGVPQHQENNLNIGTNNTDDLGNISLPNLSDVNLSLLESNLSENFSSNLVLVDPDGQARGTNAL